MVPYLGDFSEDATVYIPFNTFSSDDPSASVTITNLADADVMVHKDASLTQTATDGATVSIDFDSITGNHIVTIDTSVHADYSTGSDYLVRIEGTTVDGATVNAWIAQFSIENRHSAGALRPTTAGRTLDVTATGAAGIDWGNVENPTTAVDLSATDIQLCDTVTTNTDMRGTDSALLASSAPTNFGDLSITATTGRVDVAAIAGTAQTANDNGADINTIVTNTTNIETDTQDIQSRLPAALVSGRMSSDAVAISGSTTAADTLEAHTAAVITGTTSGTPSTTASNTDLTGFANDELIGRVIVFTAGTAAGQASDITDYASTDGVVTYSTITTAPASGDSFVII